MVNLDRLTELAAEATPGPWRMWHGDDSYAMNCYAVVSGDGRAEYVNEEGFYRQVVAITLLQEPRYATNDSKRWDEDAAFIAACDPSTVAALVEAAKAAQEYVDAEAESCRTTDVTTLNEANDQLLRCACALMGLRAALAPFKTEETT